jgi:hypothetical protein
VAFVIVARSEADEAALQLVMRQSFSETRTGVHLSDLLSPRQSFWKRQIPLLPSAATAWYFTLGIGHEDALARMLAKSPDLSVTPPKERDGISYRPDFTYLGAPAEMKTRRANLAAPGEESLTYDRYLTQLRGYCALEDTPERPCLTGYLLVVSMLEGRDNRDPLKPTEPAFRVHPVTFTAAELDETRRWLAERRDSFLAALASKDGMMQPLCAAWMCGKQRKQVLTPAHCRECDKDLGEPWASKHTATKGGAGHTVTAEVVAWQYQPRCDWWAWCKPFEVDPTRGAR